MLIAPFPMVGGIIFMELVHWPLMGELLHLVQRGGSRRGRCPTRPRCAAVLMCPVKFNGLKSVDLSGC